MAYKIEHLKLGGILDQGIAIVRNNFGMLFGIFLCLWIPFSLIAGAIQVSIMPAMPANPTMDDIRRMNEAQLQNMPVILGIALVSFLFVMPLTNAAVVYAVAERYLGRSLSATDALKKGLTKIGPLIWTSILMGLAIMGGMFLCVIPGILFALWYGLAQHVVILEDISGGSALKRSKALVRPYLGTFLVLGLVVGVLSVLLQGGSAFVPNPWVRLGVQTVINAVVMMISTAVGVVFYFSCRCGLENFDLEHLANSVGAGSAWEDESQDQTDWSSDESE